MAKAKANEKKNIFKSKKVIKYSVISLFLVGCIVAGIILIPKLPAEDTPTTVTTYNVESITYGDVDTTISGSGTLSPYYKGKSDSSGRRHSKRA